MELRHLLRRQRVMRDEDVEAPEEVELRRRQCAAVVKRNGTSALCALRGDEHR
jgi:hypothetical protein